MVLHIEWGTAQAIIQQWHGRRPSSNIQNGRENSRFYVEHDVPRSLLLSLRTYNQSKGKHNTGNVIIIIIISDGVAWVRYVGAVYEGVKVAQNTQNCPPP